MGKNSGIEWTTHTFNPWIGCTRISPACDHCYAADWDKRYHGGEHWGAGAPRRRTSKSNWRQPYKWARQARESGKRPRVFCCSLADVFDNEVPAEWREDLWQVIRDTPELDWLLLTKRIGNVRQMLPDDWGDGWPHVWLGITVVNQAEADRDVHKLRMTPAAVRWLSMEPLLEYVNLTRLNDCGTVATDALRGVRVEPTTWSDIDDAPLAPIDWVVTGGESGTHARPMHPDWARSLRDQCEAAGVPFFFKQWGEWAPDAEGAMTCDGCGKTKFDSAVTRRGVDECGYCGTSKWTEANEPLDSLCRVGKKAAGRLLDGREHNEIPETGVGV